MRKPAATARFEWTVTGLGAWMMAATYLDGWAHQHVPVETFFTAWHGFLYAGMAAAVVFLSVAAAREVRAGHPIVQALPDGYGLSLLAVLAFAGAGVLDLLWHRALGFERLFEALISPPHLLLATCGLVAAAGPLRAAWRRECRRAPWPAVISAGFVLSALTYFSQFAHPFNAPYALAPAPVADAYEAQALGVLGLVFEATLLMAVVLYLLRRFELPRGAMLLLLGVNGFAMSAMKDHLAFTVVGLAGGLAAEVLREALRPDPSRPTSIRLFAFATPTALYAAYFAAVALLGGTWWSTPLWAGSIGLAGAFGLLVSYLVVPPPGRPGGQRPRVTPVTVRMDGRDTDDWTRRRGPR